MLTPRDAKRMEKMGFTPKQFTFVIELLALNEKSNDHLTPLDKNLTRKSNAIYQKEYRNRKKNKENPIIALDSVRSNDLTQNIAPIISPHIENACAPDSLFLRDQGSKKKEVRSKKDTLGDYSPEFLLFHESYPPNNGTKKQASIRYNQQIAQGVIHETIIEGARKYANYCHVERTDPQFIKHASTWLNQRGWETNYVFGGHGASHQRINGTRDKADLAREAAERGLREMEESGFFGRQG